MARTVKARSSRVERLGTPGELGRGLLSDLAPERSLADELIAERRAEARAEARAEKRVAGAKPRRAKQ